MKTCSSIRKTSLFRRQPRATDARRVGIFSRTEPLTQPRAKRVPRRQIKSIRHWQDGHFVSMPLAA